MEKRARLKQRPQEDAMLGFYAQIKGAEEIELLRRACGAMGWPSNRAFLHMLARNYLQTVGEVQS
jgi:hypothetical protein